MLSHLTLVVFLGSIYPENYDNHLFELHAGTLEARLEAYAARQRAPQER